MLAENAKAYVAILRSHMAREDADLLGAAARTLSEDDGRELAAAFARIERELGEGESARYERLAGEIEELGEAVGTG
jgi:hemerythrin-like domain-containing protein